MHIPCIKIVAKLYLVNISKQYRLNKCLKNKFGNLEDIKERLKIPFVKWNIFLIIEGAEYVIAKLMKVKRKSIM